MNDQKLYRCTMFEDGLRKEPFLRCLLTEEQKRLLDLCINEDLFYEDLVIIVESEEHPFERV